MHRHRTRRYRTWKAAPKPIGMPSPMKAYPPSCSAGVPQSAPRIAKRLKRSAGTQQTTSMVQGPRLSTYRKPVLAECCEAVRR